VTKTKGARQEETRFEVPRVFLHEIAPFLGESVQGMKAKLAFNLDEIGMSEWENRKDKRKIVPKTVACQMISRCASRNVKHISINSCITAGAESLLPYIEISQDFEPLRKSLINRGARLGFDFRLRLRSKL
jgi:hypothetical protein